MNVEDAWDAIRAAERGKGPGGVFKVTGPNSLHTPGKAETVKVTLLIEMTYAEGHECTRTEVVELEPKHLLAEDHEDFDDEGLYEHTGCACGEDVLPFEDRDHSHYQVTITAAENESLIGQTYEWMD